MSVCLPSHSKSYGCWDPNIFRRQTVHSYQPAADAAISVWTYSPGWQLHLWLTRTPPLLNSVNEEVIVRLKWGQTEYKGRLVSVDSYMNIQLTGTEEFVDHKSTGSLGQVLIRLVLVTRDTEENRIRSYIKGSPANWFMRSRCNNVLWIQGAGKKKDEDTHMDG
ncbi:hypothetical protein GP486_002784 [Trichoglossum hirsutum]|uniref:Sm protein F n=1 Tax=Trichoglossum hirsutum TaxID=265104 RepID=A0A9P8LE36_9PEZI|nr:hypothetical protein GP486_002784 [Trichoglossum hirsutum]